MVESRLKPVNALIALWSSGGSYPEVLRECGYYVAGVEAPVRVENGTVVIDVVMFHPERNVVLAGEAKSGANVDLRQAARYGRLRADAVIQDASINVSRGGDLYVQPLYCCLAENVDRVILGLARAGVDYPVLSLDDKVIEHHGAPFLDEALTDAFAAPVPVQGWPPRIIPVDRESPDHMFDDLVVTAAVAAISSGRTEASVPALAEEAIPHLAIHAKRARKQLEKRVDAAARRVARRDEATFEYLRRTGTRDPAVLQFKRSPETAAPQGRTQVYQAIMRPHRAAPEDRVATQATQMSFFDEMMGEFLQADGTMVDMEDEE